MKMFKFFILFILFFGLFLINLEGEKEWPVLKGPYLGQKPPGMKPEIFAPGIISTEKDELNSVFSPKGDEFFYAICTSTIEEKRSGRYSYIIMYSKQVNGIWIRPKVAPFSGKFSDVDMAFSADGNRLYFCSDRPTPWNSSPNRDIWYCERLLQGWSEPKNPGIPLNSPMDETYPTFTSDGDMYFSSSREGGKGRKDIYYAKFINRKFSKPVIIADPINTMFNEGDTFIAPDENYLLVTIKGRPDNMGGDGLYISFKQRNGSWSPVRNLKFSTEIIGGCPMLSPDGKYLFYSLKGDIYWVDAKIIQKLRSKV